MKATNEGFANGEMGVTFRTGLIKLIPKKGDATKIGDWRNQYRYCAVGIQ